MRMVGLDIAGWHDIAARDWDVDDDQLENLKIVDGGIGAVAIKDGTDCWLGGPQASLAPHGLGKGWGELGGSERRIGIADCYAGLIRGSETVRDAYTAAVESLTRHADEAILNIADILESDEGARSRIISAARGKMRRVRLLWRPVSLCLDALRTGLIEPDDVGHWFGFLIHSDRGFEYQRLRIREDSEHPGHYAPERERYGEILQNALGIRNLVEKIHHEIISTNTILNDNSFGRIELAPGILAGRIAPSSRGVVRHDNRTWIEIKLPEQISLPATDEFITSLARTLNESGPVKKLFFTSPIAPDLIEQIYRAILAIQRECIKMPWECLASGALHAGRIIERGLPHYFDRLVPISLAVFQDDQPIFTDLADRNATLPANKEYVAPPYRNLEWPRGKKEVEFNILKADTELRRWVISVDIPPPADVPVELTFRQTPGQSWANLYLTSQEWEVLQRSPVALNWEGLQPSDETKDEVLKRLKRPPPTIPTRIIEQPTIEFWIGNKKYAPLSPVLHADRIDTYTLARLLSRSMRAQTMGGTVPARVRTVGTDGNLPEGLHDNDIAAFERIINSLESTLMQAVSARKPRSNNDELRALTWVFVRCPMNIQTAIVDALECYSQNRSHPLLVPPASRTVIIQGAGRAVSSVDLIRRVLLALTTIKANNDTFSSIAMLLSRRMEAPKALDASIVDRIAKSVSAELSTLADTTGAKGFKNRFKNSLLALAGLFRYREVEPYALLKGSNQTAMALWDSLTLIKKALTKHASVIAYADTKIALVSDLIKHLEGNGDPNVLIQIENSEEGQDDEDED